MSIYIKQKYSFDNYFFHRMRTYDFIVIVFTKFKVVFIVISTLVQTRTR